MTIRHPIRRALARICSADTMARVIDPTLADIRFEDGRPTWRGYLALARALTAHAWTSLPGAVSRVWTDDDHALPRAVVACAVTSLVLATPLVATAASGTLVLGLWRTAWLLAPQALILALPPSLLVAIPVAFRGTRTRRAIVRGLALSAVCAAATFVLMNRIMPDANQAFRVEMSEKLAGRHFELERGPAEMTVREVKARIEVLRLTPGGVRAARRLEYDYQLRLVLTIIAVPLGILAVAIAMTALARMRPVLIGVSAMVGYVLVLFPLEGGALRLLGRFEAIPPVVVVWTPPIALLLVASMALRRSSLRSPATLPPPGSSNDA
jgi:hypothetical protein